MGLLDDIGEAVGDFVGGITGAKQQAEAVQQAGELSAAASEKGIEEVSRQFDKLVELMSPFVDVGAKSVERQAAIAGLAGPEAQQEAIAGIEESPVFKALQRQGEESILQNAAATGGLRGGNVQTALAQFRPQLLGQQIQQQYSRLGGLTSAGQAAAAGQAGAGTQFGSDISTLLQNAALARGQGIIAGGGVQRQSFGDLLQLGGLAAGAGLF